MSKVVYVLSYQGEPDHVYTSIEPIRQQCHKYMNDHYCHEELDFFYWLEDHEYAEDEREQAWEDYVERILDYGEWGEYSWSKVPLD